MPPGPGRENPLFSQLCTALLKLPSQGHGLDTGISGRGSTALGTLPRPDKQTTQSSCQPGALGTPHPLGFVVQQGGQGRAAKDACPAAPTAAAGVPGHQPSRDPPCLWPPHSTYRPTLQVGGSPSLFPQNTAPLQKQPGVCRAQVRPSGGTVFPTWDSLPIGAVVTGTVGQPPPTRSWTAPSLMGRLVL